MGNLIAELRQITGGPVFTQPILIACGDKRAVIPPPTAVGDAAATYRSCVQFPDGAPNMADFAAMLGVIAFDRLPAPLNAVQNVTLNGLSIEFVSAGSYPSRFTASFGYVGIRIAFLNASITGITLTCDCVMPVDELLAATTIRAGATLDLDGAGIAVEIDSAGRVVFLLNNGGAISLKEISNLVVRGGGTPFELPVPAPSFRNARVEFNLASPAVSITADVDGAGLDCFCCHVSLRRLFVEAGSECAASVLATGSIGGLAFTGFIDLVNAASLSARMPAIRPAELIAAAIPKLGEAAQLLLGGIQFPDSTLTLTTGKAHQALRIATKLDPAAFVPGPIKTFLTQIGIGVPHGEVATDLTVMPSPVSALLALAMLSGPPIELVKHSGFSLEGLWLEIDVAATTPAFGLKSHLQFTFGGQTFELGGTIQATEAGARVQAVQMTPAVWQNALGIQGLNLSGLNLEVGIAYTGVPTFGFGGAFCIRLPGGPFAGNAQFLFDSGNPGASVFSLSFNQIDLGIFFDLFFPVQTNLPLHSLLRQVRFEHCSLFFAAAGCTINDVAYPAGYRIRGDAAFFGWGTHLDVAVDPARGLSFDCEMDRPVRIAEVFAFSAPHDPARGPRVAFSTYPKPTQALCKVTGLLQVAGAFEVVTDLVFDETGFALAATITLFRTAEVSLKSGGQFAAMASASLPVHLAYTNTDALADNVNGGLKVAAKAAADAISAAQGPVNKAKRKLKPLRSTYEKARRNLRHLIKKLHHAKWYSKAYWAGKVAKAEAEALTAELAYRTAKGVLDGAVQALNAVVTVENVALCKIAGFITTNSVRIHSVSCDAAASGLRRPHFTLKVELGVQGLSQNLWVDVDFSNAQMASQLAKAIERGIIQLYQ